MMKGIAYTGTTVTASMSNMVPVALLSPSSGKKPRAPKDRVVFRCKQSHILQHVADCLPSTLQQCIEAEHKCEAKCLAVESCMLNADVKGLTVKWSLLSSVKAFTSCIRSLSSSRTTLTASLTVLVMSRDPLPSLARPNNFSALPHWNLPS